jgi:hypothetical protein
MLTSMCMCTCMRARSKRCWLLYSGSIVTRFPACRPCTHQGTPQPVRNPPTALQLVLKPSMAALSLSATHTLCAAACTCSLQAVHCCCVAECCLVPEHCCKRPCACSTAASHSCRQQETTQCIASVDAAAATGAHSTAARLQALLLLPPLLPPLLLLLPLLILL